MHLAPQMATSPCPRINEVLHPLVPAMVVSTTMAPTVAHGTSSLRAAARPYSHVRLTVASNGMIATGSFFHIQSSTYHPPSSPLTHAWMVPVCTINLFVGLAGVSDPAEVRPSQLHDPYASGRRGKHTSRMSRPWRTTPIRWLRRQSPDP